MHVYAICNEKEPNYPFGTFMWYFYNDTCSRAGDEQMVGENIYKLPISLSACDGKKDFNCRDGTW
jgi:hypothetical protein